MLCAIIFLIACSSKESNSNKNVAIATNDSNVLDNNIQVLELEYVDWFCACANWATEEDIKKYKDTGKLSNHCIFIEPSNSTIDLPDTLGYSGDLIKFTGRFYKNKGYPKGYFIGEEKVDKAKVFKYTNYVVLRSKYREFVNDSNYVK